MSRYPGIRIGNGWGFEFAQFSSVEVCKIVGISPALLRLWRSRGQVCGGGGKCGTFNSRETAELMIKFELSKHGVPPSESDEVSSAAAQIMLWFALLNCDGACEAIGCAKDADNFIERFRADDEVAARLTDKPKVREFLVKIGSGIPEFRKELGPEMLEFATARSFSVISLPKAAHDLAIAARRPLFTVDVSGDTPEPMVRRLTGYRVAS